MTFVGAGALATGLVIALHHAGYVVEEVIYRSARGSANARAIAKATGCRPVRLEQARFSADVLFLAVPDDSIAECAEVLAKRTNAKGKVVLHGSGALSSEVLSPLKARGAAVGSLHPLMTFVRSRQPELAGVWFAAEGSSAALRFAKAAVADLGGNLIPLKKQHKALYHAFGAMLSPLLVSELEAATTVAARAGISEKQARALMRPILFRTLENFLAHGAQAAFSGPFVRGDVNTVTRHIKALGRSADELRVYRELARYAVSKLEVKNRRELQKALAAK